MERSGGGSGVPRLRTFCGGQARVRAGKLPLKYLAIFVRGVRRPRAASAISARQSDSDQPMRRNQRVLAPLLFDHVVGSRLQRECNGEADRMRRPAPSVRARAVLSPVAFQRARLTR